MKKRNIVEFLLWFHSPLTIGFYSAILSVIFLVIYLRNRSISGVFFSIMVFVWTITLLVALGILWAYISDYQERRRLEKKDKEKSHRVD